MRICPDRRSSLEACDAEAVAVGVWPDGHLDVWHTPPARRWLRWNHTPPDPCPTDELLAVRLAALDIKQPDTVCTWITSNLIGRSLHLRPLHLSTTDNSLHCIIHYRKV
ncbi:hypothetical protein GBAR_LOCUS17809 [Geodia barretti]|uniref:Uncharacterized protein n=1 Tax=Geodia barretti TaxID=519541 RepID=A0AA35WYK8_GEOBA|nr:hypothetical protein GBAR_LOCUS17809 [Geodia barretti]